jgi:hypothetical protein
MVLGLQVLFEVVSVIENQAAEVTGELLNAAHMTLGVLVLRESMLAVERSIARPAFKHGLVSGVVSVPLHHGFGGEGHVTVRAWVDLAVVRSKVPSGCRHRFRPKAYLLHL